MASGIEHRIGAPDIVVAKFPAVLISSYMILTPEKMQRRRFEGSRVSDLRFDRERILYCYPFKNGLVRASKARDCIPDESIERGLALDDGHLLVVAPHLASDSQKRRVFLDNLPPGKAARLMDRLEHTRKSSQTKYLISELVSDVPGNHAAEGIANHREGSISEVFVDVVQGPLGDLVCTGNVDVTIAFRPREVNIDALPSGIINGVLQREHDPMIYPESVDGDEREAFS